ncbi:MAG TPA: MmcQ/YjbR family DNA-binding protein [Pyrinomonadaceae bacterium]|nr:MmcQ/YjbR family DNA-binding protein [Pyrinomonadaceae bacterium]
MDIESVRAYCLSFPHATENVQWGNDLVFKIAGKMFAVVVLEGASKYCLSFKCTEAKFAELIEQDGIDPAPYSARYHWVALQSFDVLSDRELKALLRNSYDLVFDKLPKKMKAELEKSTATKTKKRAQNH